MFETAELGQRVTKEEFKSQEPALRDGLLAVQRELRNAGLPVIIVMAGVDGSGKGETVNLLMEWLDPRGVSVNALSDPSDEELERPPFYRFFRQLPARGHMGIFLGSWYTEPIRARVYRENKPSDLERMITEIVQFEKMLADDGALILKFWLHLSKKDQERRLKTLESDRLTRWRVRSEDWKNFRRYGRFRRICEEVLRKTSTKDAPWHVVEGKDPQFRYLAVAHIVMKCLKDRLSVFRSRPAPRPPEIVPVPPNQKEILSTLDYTKAVPAVEYRERLQELQGRLNLLARKIHRKKHSVVVVFEGSDAAGKGGTIRRMTEAMDARTYQVVPICAPTDEERAHPYMWRFWRKLPRSGQIMIFDRSWYGRVLVEAVEGFCTDEEWVRAYPEINDFEDHLTRHGTLVVKFWLAITKDEQARRFKERQETSFKQFKITAEDWRNREKWELYESLVHRMVERTSTSSAPWTLIPANDKNYARLQALQTLSDRIDAMV